MLIIMVVSNYKRKNGSLSIEKILKNRVTNYYRKYSNFIYIRNKFFYIFYHKKNFSQTNLNKILFKKKYNYYVLKQEKKNKLFIIELYKFITKSSLIYIFNFIYIRDYN